MIKFRTKDDPQIIETPSNEDLVRYLAMTAKFQSPTVSEYMKEYARRAVIERDADIRATDFDSFVDDLISIGDIVLIK